MNKTAKPIGIPCVGGKSELAPMLAEVIEKACFNNGVSTYISACGGGGKDILALNPEYFDKLIYNEIEKPLAMLMRALTQIDGLDEIRKAVNKVFETALSVEVSGDWSEDEKREIRLRAMFEYIYKLYADEYTDEVGVDENPDDLFTVAAHGVILVYGSVQNNRKGILYKSKDGKRDFYKTLYTTPTYLEKLSRIAKKASNITAINGNCFPLIEKYKSHKDVLIYIDPPYWNCSNDYTNTFSFDNHIQLTELCADADCKVMISMHAAGIAPYLCNLCSRDEWYMYELKPISHHSIGKNISKKSKQAMLMNSSLMFKIKLIKAVGTADYREMRDKVLKHIKNLPDVDDVWHSSEVEWLEKYSADEAERLEKDGKLESIKRDAINEFTKNELEKITLKSEHRSQNYNEFKELFPDKIDYRVDAVTEYVFSNFEIDHEGFQLVTIDNEGEYPIFGETKYEYYSETENVHRVIREAIPRMFLEKYSKLKGGNSKINGFTDEILSDAEKVDEVLTDVWDTIFNLHVIASDKYDVAINVMSIGKHKTVGKHLKSIINKFEVDEMLESDEDEDVCESSEFDDIDVFDESDETVNLIVQKAVIPAFKQLLYEAYDKQKLFAQVSGIISKDEKERKKTVGKASSAYATPSVKPVKKKLGEVEYNNVLERMENAMKTM